MKASITHNEGRKNDRVRGLTIKSSIKAGNYGRFFNHNEAQVAADLRSAECVRGLKVKTSVKAGPGGAGNGCCSRSGGDWIINHNETQATER